MSSPKKLRFTIRDKILEEVVFKIERSGSRVFSLRSGSDIMIRGAGKFLKKELDGRIIWRGREVVANFEKLSPCCLYLLTTEKVWKLSSVDKSHALFIDIMCKAWLMPHEIASWESKQQEKKNA